MQTEFALAQLDPVGEHIVVVVDLISELANVSGIGLLGRFHLVEDAIDERGDAIDKREFGTLLEVATLATLHTQFHGGYLLGFLFEEIVAHLSLRLLLVQVVEEPERETEQDDGCHDSNQHQIEL